MLRWAIKLYDWRENAEYVVLVQAERKEDAIERAKALLANIQPTIRAVDLSTHKATGIDTPDASWRPNPTTGGEPAFEGVARLT